MRKVLLFLCFIIFFFVFLSCTPEDESSSADEKNDTYDSESEFFYKRCYV